jgi:hypothetical protein
VKKKKAIKRCLDCEQAKQLNNIKHAFLNVFLGFNPQIDSEPSPPPGPEAPKVDIWGKRSIVQAEMTTRLISFLNQKMSTGFGKKIQASVFYDEFADFWRSNYPGDPLPSNTSFGRNVARLAGPGPFAGIFKNKTNGSIFYNGIGARNDQQSEMESIA